MAKPTDPSKLVVLDTPGVTKVFDEVPLGEDEEEEDGGVDEVEVPAIEDDEEDDSIGPPTGTPAFLGAT